MIGIDCKLVQGERKLKEQLLQIHKKREEEQKIQKQKENEITEKDRQEFALNYQKKQGEILKLQSQVNRLLHLSDSSTNHAEEIEELQKIIEGHKQRIKDYEERDKYRKVHRIRLTYPWLSQDEVLLALVSECDNNEDRCIDFFSEEANLHQIRLILAKDVVSNSVAKRLSNYGPLKKEYHIQQTLRQGRKSKGERILYHNKPHDLKGAKKLRLDDAIGQGNFEGWSEARKKVYELRDKNPNAYYYRFNDPGEKQRNGKWTDEEDKLFFQRMNEVGVNGNWGVFSMTIPGRVGYQCSNYYRQLIEAGRVVDPNYQIINGKAKFIFGNSRRNLKEKPVQTNVEPKPKPPKPKVERPKKEKKERVSSSKKEVSSSSGDDTKKSDKKDKKKKPVKKKKKMDDEDDDDDEEFVIKSWTKRRKEEIAACESGDVKPSLQPLNQYADPITFAPLENPYMSPSGYVASYSTWLSALTDSGKQKNICPFTRQPLAKRHLIKVTWDNCDQLMSEMKNLVKLDDED